MVLVCVLIVESYFYTFVVRKSRFMIYESKDWCGENKSLPLAHVVENKKLRYFIIPLWFVFLLLLWSLPTLEPVIIKNESHSLTTGPQGGWQTFRFMILYIKSVSHFQVTKLRD